MFWFAKRSDIKLVTAFSILVVTGCTSVPERNPLPSELTKEAIINGIPNARFWGDERPKFFLPGKFQKLTEKDFLRDFSGIYGKQHNYLAISGGGSNGAFGAGLIAGWTQTGTRPEFIMVTGISTGSLTAPFAFLGPDYDDVLKELYTTTSTKDIIKKRNVLLAAFSDSVADTAPLRRLIEKYITPELINAIAKEHRRGRRLFVGTFNLDAQRSVIWNITAIAASNSPRKISLIHDILQASAAIPVAFPPIVINIDINGTSYDEMQVDGGTGSQVFVYPAAVDWRQVMRKLKTRGKTEVYVIRNASMTLNYHGVKRNVLPIATRSIDALIQTQGAGDLYKIYTLCERDGNDFNLAYIPSSFKEEPAETFDPVYMAKLYELGYDMAIKGYPWLKAPPGYMKPP